MEKEEVKIPTLKEKIEKGISDKDWIMICYKANKKRQCFREANGHSLCDLCPKKLEVIVNKGEKPIEERKEGFQEKGWLTEEEFRSRVTSSRNFQGVK